MAKFFIQKFVIFNMITDTFSAEKWGTLERARRYIFKNFLNLDCQIIKLINFECLIIYSKCNL